MIFKIQITTIERRNLNAFRFRTEQNGWVVERFGFRMISENGTKLLGFQTLLSI